MTPQSKEDTLYIADRVRQVGMSPTMKGTMEAERLRRQGVDVVDLGAGEPDFPTPAHVTEAAITAIRQQFTKYTANPGIAELREAVGQHYQARYGVTYRPDEVIITAGGKQALFHAALALFNPGDEVITHAPGWPTLIEQIKLAGARPVIARTHAEDGFALTADVLLAGVTPNTRAIVINSPGNPTGALLSENEARKLARETAKRGIWLILDLCYEQLIYDGVSHNLPQILGEAQRDRLVLCGSMSKSYAMTGWRCGWMAAPKPIVSAANALQSHSTSNVNSITQRAAVTALTGAQTCVAEMLAEYKRRRDHVLSVLAGEPRFGCFVPQGAFYVFPDITAFLSPSGTRTSIEFADGLLKEEHVVTTAGEAFDAPGFLRLSYAASVEKLDEGLKRLFRYARKLAP
jgi:aspartate aminotransferase